MQTEISGCFIGVQVEVFLFGCCWLYCLFKKIALQYHVVALTIVKYWDTHMLWKVVFKNLASAMLFLAQSTPRVLEKPSAAHCCSCHPLNRLRTKPSFSGCPQGWPVPIPGRVAASPAPVPVTTAVCALPGLGDFPLEIQGLDYKSLHLHWKRLPWIGCGVGGQGEPHLVCPSELVGVILAEGHKQHLNRTNHHNHSPAIWLWKQFE